MMPTREEVRRPIYKDSRASVKACLMPSIAILREVQQLYKVSDRLDSLAEQHPLFSEALITIAGNVRNTATLLEVLVATKVRPRSGLDPASS